MQTNKSQSSVACPEQDRVPILGLPTARLDQDHPALGTFKMA